MNLLDLPKCYFNNFCPLCHKKTNNHICRDCNVSIDKHNYNVQINYRHNNIYIMFVVYDYDDASYINTYLILSEDIYNHKIIYNSYIDQFFSITNSTFEDLNKFIDKLTIFK